MRTTAQALDAGGIRTLDHELGVVWAAIDLVASGLSVRVTCAGMRFAPQLVAEAAAAALAAGISVTPLPTTDEAPTGLLVERVARG
jgi:hypothetical protein